MARIVIVLMAGCLASGCSATRKIEVSSSNGLTVIDYGASRRGAYLYDVNGKPVIVSEPAPDIATEITSSLGLSAKTIGDIADPQLKADYAKKVVDLANRSQTLQVLRESLFRLSEMGASTELSADQRMEMFSKVLDTVRLIALTEFANSEAPEGVKEQAMKTFLQDTATGTVTIPD